MGTMIALLLVFSTLVGCAGETLTNVKNALPGNAFTLSVELETYAEAVSDEDGTVLAECSYKLPVLRALLEDGTPLEKAATPGQERAMALLETFNAYFDAWKSGLQDMAEHAREDRALGGAFLTYEDQLDCVVYQTDRLISIQGTYSTFTGGAHTNTLLMSWNFDLETGEFFQPELLDDSGDLLEFVRRELLRQARQLGAKPGETDGPFWPNYADTLAEWSNYAVSFDGEGMTVGFSPYDLASYAAGPQIFHLTYEQLSPHLGQHGKSLLGLT